MDPQEHLFLFPHHLPRGAIGLSQSQDLQGFSTQCMRLQGRATHPMEGESYFIRVQMMSWDPPEYLKLLVKSGVS